MPEISCAVLTTLHKSDCVGFAEKALASICEQRTNHIVRIYLCVDGPLSKPLEEWLQINIKAFYKVVYNPVNMGLATSLNNLIDILEDEMFIFRMDLDDISHPDRIDKQISMMQKASHLSLVGCQAFDIDEEGEITGVRNYPTNSAAVEGSSIKMMPILHPTFCIRASIFRDRTIRYPEKYLCEDLAFLLLLLEKKLKVSNHPETLFYWRISKNFFLRRWSFKRAITEFRLYKKAIKLQKASFIKGSIWPTARLILRLLPPKISQTIYACGIRKKLMRE